MIIPRLSILKLNIILIYSCDVIKNLKLKYLVELYDYEIEYINNKPNTCILYMQYVNGVTLNNYPIDINVYIKIINLLDQLYTKGIIHGDLYYHNIMVTSEGDPYLIDFSFINYVKDIKFINYDNNEYINYIPMINNIPTIYTKFTHKEYIDIELIRYIDIYICLFILFIYI